MLKRLFKQHEFVLALTIIILSVIIQTINREFLSIGNIFSMAESAITLAIYALGVYLVIVSGDIDVSFPAIAVFSMYLTTKILLSQGWTENIFLAFLLAGVIGILLGLFNAIFISTFKLPTLIVTLGTLNLFRGFLLAFIGIKVINNPPRSMVQFQKSKVLTVINEHGWRISLPLAILIPIALIIVTWLIVRYTKIGRGIYAIGGDRISAERVGFSISQIQYFLYGFVGLLAGIGGIVHGSLLRRVNPFGIVGNELTVIAAVVLGGTRITGGRGTITGTILGVLMITIINQNLILLGISSYWQQVVIGLLIIISVGITSYREKRVKAQ